MVDIFPLSQTPYKPHTFLLGPTSLNDLQWELLANKTYAAYMEFGTKGKISTNTRH